MASLVEETRELKDPDSALRIGGAVRRRGGGGGGGAGEPKPDSFGQRGIVVGKVLELLFFFCGGLLWSLWSASVK